MPRPTPALPARRPRGRLIRIVAAALGVAALTATSVVPAADAATWKPRHWKTVIGSSAGFVTLGDSYSSGEGIGFYRDGTDTSTNRCHRSEIAYGPLLAAVRRQPHTFAACSGARTTDFYAPNADNAGEPPQLSRINRRTNTVTFTVGGNDAGFSLLLGKCVRARVQSTQLCSETEASIFQGSRVQISALTGATPAAAPLVPIPDILDDIAATARRSTVYVGGYPELFSGDAANYPGAPSINGNGACTLYASSQSPADYVIDYADAQQINLLARQLNQALAASVDRFNATTRTKVRAVFAPPTVFAGHALCDAEPWIYPVLPTLVNGQPVPRPESFHPNPYGNLAYAVAFYAAMRPGRPVPRAVVQQSGVDPAAARRAGVLSGSR